MPYVSLHNHATKSLLDGAMTAETMAKRVVELGQSAVALTDHGNLFGIIEFWDACKTNNIQPIIGLETYVAPESCLIKEKIEGRPSNYHLTLLAQDLEGLHNLYKLSSIAFLKGFYHKPRVDYSLLKQYNRGIICLSGCLAGRVQWALSEHPVSLDEGLKEASLDLETLYDIFGDRLYMELQRIIPVQDKIIPLQLKLAQDMGIPVVATTDSHYARPDDVDFHEQLVCIVTNKTIQDEKRMNRMDGLYLKSTEEMQELFKDIPEAITNTEVIAKRCEPLSKEKPFESKGYIFPIFTDSRENDIEYFKSQAQLGLTKRGFSDQKVYQERLAYEIGVIEQMGFASYFLVVADYIRWAKQNDIRVGAGRGSGAGSLVAYCLEITNINPIEYGLMFERFLNPGRRSMPDIDCDFDPEHRTDVFGYIAERYGRDKVSQIVTFGEFKPRGSVRDFARVQNQPYSLGDEINKLIPPAVRGVEPTWEETLQVKDLHNPKYASIINMAKKSMGINRQRGIHAGGLVIADVPLMDAIPLCKGKNDEVVSQFTMEELERLGLVKMDILGVSSLTAISKCIDLIQKTQKVCVDIDNIPRDDAKVFELISAGETSGLFQLDQGGGIRNLCIRIKPKNIIDLAAISALYRPGPLDSGLAESYARRCAGIEEIEYWIPELKPILQDTKGVLIFQEQCMKIAQELAGYSLAEADDLRKAIGKKNAEKMAKEEDKFVAGMVKNNIPRNKAQFVWDAIKKFAEYGFNASHAVAYSLITYQTAWLKTYYPAEFYCALLTQHVAERDKIIEYLGDCRKLDIQVLPPDVNESDIGFSVSNGIIRFGLAGIKDVGEKVSGYIVSDRIAGGPYKDIISFYNRTRDRGVNKRTLEALVKAGALASTELSRAAGLAVIESLVEYPKEIERYESKLATYNKRYMAYQDREAVRDEMVIARKKAPPSLKMPQKPDLPLEPKIPAIEEFSSSEVLRLENEMLGFYVTSHPLYAYQTEIMQNTTAHTGSLEDHMSSEILTMIGVVATVREIATKSGKLMCAIDFEDLHGHLEVLCFSKEYANFKTILSPGHVIEIDARLDIQEEAKKLIIVNAKRLAVKNVAQPKIEFRSAQIYIEQEQLNNDIINKITDIIASCTGKIKVDLVLCIGNKRLKFDCKQTISQEAIKHLHSLGLLVTK